MDNFIPKGTGNSRLMKSSIPANTTLEQLITMLRNGTFPYDIGEVNEDGIIDRGTPLNKGTLLKDGTSDKLGIARASVPDDALQKLSAASLYGVANGYITLGQLDDGDIFTYEYSDVEQDFVRVSQSGDNVTIKQMASPQTELTLPADTEITSEPVNVLRTTLGELLAVSASQIVGGARVKCGTYVGDGTAGVGNETTIDLGFQPKFVIVTSGNLSTTPDGQWWKGFLWTRGSALIDATGVTYGGAEHFTESKTGLSWYATGQSVTADLADVQQNTNGTTYYYLAIGGGLGSDGDTPSLIPPDITQPQEFSDPQKETARDNIGAASTEMVLATFPRKTLASAAIHTFSDGADNIPIKAMSVAVRAVQDLHGQTSPYPSGGGKNKLDLVLSAMKSANTGGTWSGNAYTYNGVTFTVQTDADGNITGIDVHGTASANANFILSPDAERNYSSDLLFNGVSGGSSNTYYAYFYDVTSSAIRFNLTSGDATVTASTIAGHTCRVVFSVLSGTQMNHVVIKPMLRLSSEADAAFAPYSNYCPIVGWDEARLVGNGINQWDEVWEQGNINSDGQNAPSTTIGRSKNYIRVDASTTYYIKGTGIKPYFYDINKAYLSTTTSKTDTTITTPANTAYMRFTVQGTSYGNNISVNYPSTDTSYHAYNGNLVTIDFGGTVYGGQLTYNGGLEWEFTGEYGIVKGTASNITRQSEKQWVISHTGIPLALIPAANIGLMSDTFAPAPNTPETGKCLLNVYGAIRFTTESDYADAAALVGAIGEPSFVYPLANPQTVTLTASDEVVTQYADNVMFADCGDSTLTYRQDIGLVIGG